MRDTSRQITPRRPPASVLPTETHSATSAARVEALRRLVAAGRYQVNARRLAQEICRAARVAWE